MNAVATPRDFIAQQQAALERAFPQTLVGLPSGAQVAVRQCGPAQGAPVLAMLHGISSGAASWLDVALDLAPGHRSVAWDMPGYGASTPFAGPASAQDYAQRLGETLDALGIDRCILVTQSLGAIVASAFVQQDARRVAGIVLLCPAQGYGHDAAAADRVLKERLEALASLGVEGLAARIDSRLLTARASDDAREWVRWNTARMTAQGYAQAVELLASSRLQAPPSGIPVQVHVGDNDVVTPPASCEQAAQLMGASFGTFADAGHASPIEQPHVVAKIIAGAAKQMEAQPRA